MTEPQPTGEAVQPVKCKDCGYLGVRNLQTWQVDESDPEYRLSGVMPGPAAPKYGEHPMPLCFCFAYPLDDEYRATRDGGTANSRVNAIQIVLAKSRTCPKFADWQHGFTPKEHLQMDLIEKQRAWQASESEKARAWQAVETRRNTWLSVGGTVVAAVIGAAAGWLFSTLDDKPTLPATHQTATDAPQSPPPLRGSGEASPESSRN